MTNSCSPPLSADDRVLCVLKVTSEIGTFIKLADVVRFVALGGSGIL